jgi:PAS domain S-box-containing protein
MKDEEKTVEQLINELVGICQGIAELQASGTQGKKVGGYRSAQDRFAGIYKYSKDAICYATLKGVFLNVNDSFCWLTGYSREELLDTKKYQDITPEEYHEYEAQMVEKVLRTGEAVEYEKEFIAKDGSRVPVSLTVFLVKEINGEPTALAAIIKNSTDPNVLYEESQKQAEKLRALYERLNKRNKDLEILNTITQAVHKSLDLEEVYKIALDMTIALENVDMAMIYLVDGDRKQAVLQAHRDIPEDYILRAGRIPYPKGITWKVLNTGKILNVEDIQKELDAGTAGRDLGHHGVLGIPITSEEKTIGVIWFLSYKERRFDKQEVDLLSSIGNQISIAIAKAKLYRELSKKSRYETIISTVTRAVHRSINLQEVLENAVESLNKNVHEADSVAIYLVEKEEAVLKAYRGYTDQYVDRAGRIPYPKGVTWKTIIEGEPLYCSNVDKDTVIGPAGRRMGIKSYLCMPIHYEGKPSGTLNISSFQKNAFDEEELFLLGIVSQQIELAFNNARQVEALSDSEERYRALYEDNPSMYFTIDAESKILSVNQFGAEQLGYTAQELVGQSVLKVIHIEDENVFLTNLTKCLKNPRQVFQWEFRKVRKDGSLLWVRGVTRTVHDADGSAVVFIVCDDITGRKHAEEKLLNSREQLRALSARLQLVREEERTMIAREIHDELGQALTGLKMDLSWLARRLTEKQNSLLNRITSMLKLVDKAIQTVREISAELRPGVLDDFGLTAAIEWQTKQFQTKTGISYNFTSGPKNIILDKERSTAIFRIFQEALTNVVRHANATRINISLKEKADNIILTVRDNGEGIKESEISNANSLGLLGMRERAILLGGVIKISAAPGKGTKVTLRIPLD